MWTQPTSLPVGEETLTEEGVRLLNELLKERDDAELLALAEAIAEANDIDAKSVAVVLKTLATLVTTDRVIRQISGK